MRTTTNTTTAARILFAPLVALAMPAWSSAQPATTTTATAPSTVPAGAKVLTATVTAVKGVVQVREDEGKPWQSAKVGMKLTQGAEFRTGVRSAVQFTIEPDQTVTLDRLGTLKVLQAYLEPGKVTTDLGVKYGRTHYDIKAADLQHQSTIRSPGSALSVRGTDVTYEDQVPWVPTAVSREGRAEFRNMRREMVAFGGTKRATVAADKNSPAQQALANTKVDPRTAFAGRTEAEDELLLSLASVGGTDAQGVRTVQNLAKIEGFQGTFVGVPEVPGPLEFILNWQGTSGAPNSLDLDLLVTDPAGRTASFSNPNIGTGSSVGQHTGDDRGTSGFGAESVVWGLFFPAGKYTLSAVNHGAEDAQVFISGFRGQKSEQVAAFGIDPDPAIVLPPGQTVSRSVEVRDGGSDNGGKQRGLQRERARERGVRLGAGAGRR